MQPTPTVVRNDYAPLPTRAEPLAATRGDRAKRKRESAEPEEAEDVDSMIPSPGATSEVSDYEESAKRQKTIPKPKKEKKDKKEKKEKKAKKEKKDKTKVKWTAPTVNPKAASNLSGGNTDSLKNQQIKDAEDKLQVRCKDSTSPESGH